MIIFKPYVEELRKWLDKPQVHERLISEGYTTEQLEDAFDVYLTLARATEKEYFRLRPRLGTNVFFKGAFKKAISQLHQNVGEGKIVPLPKHFWMTREESMAQCDRANQAFTERPDLQRLLADANYAFFTDKTMVSATGLLDLNLDSMMQEGLSNLNISNLMIGYLVKNTIVQDHFGVDKEKTRTVRIKDIGSGTGATLAAIVQGIAAAAELLTRSGLNPDISVDITAIEGCYAFKQVLEREMIPAVHQKLNSIDGVTGDIRLEYGDLVDKVGNGNYRPLNHLQLVTSNYVFHRLSDNAKEEVIGEIAGMRGQEKLVVLFADMYRNTSGMPNRGYFNFAFNGPLNPGNDAEFMASVMTHYSLMSQVVMPRTFGEEGDTFRKGTIPKQLMEQSERARREEQGFVIYASQL